MFSNAIWLYGHKSKVMCMCIHSVIVQWYHNHNTTNNSPCSTSYCVNCRQELSNARILSENREFNNYESTNKTEGKTNVNRESWTREANCFNMNRISGSNMRCAQVQCYVVFTLAMDPENYPVHKDDVIARKVTSIWLYRI